MSRIAYSEAEGDRGPNKKGMEIFEFIYVWFCCVGVPALCILGKVKLLCGPKAEEDQDLMSNPMAHRDSIKKK